MKNNSILYVLVCFALLSFSSCLFQEENLFDESPAKRINTELQKDFDLLSAPSNGWIMDYFPTYEQEGYTFLMNFDKNGSVKIASKNRWFNNRYADNTSLYEMIGDNGPVLSFNTYNPLFHFFANPEELPETPEEERGRGLEGDYEFIVMQSSADQFLLKGKKRGVYTNLRRLPDNQDWRAYFQQLDDLNAFLFDKNTYYTLTLQTGDLAYVLSNGISHIFTSVPQGGDAITESEKVPFIVTDYGICFSQPFKAAQNFRLNDEKNALVCTDEKVNAKITGINPIDLFFNVINVNKSFLFSTDNMGAEVKAAYDKISQSMSERSRTLRWMTFTNDRTYGNVLVICMMNNQSRVETEVKYNYSFVKNSDNEISLSFKGFGDKTVDQNGKVVYDSFAGVSDLLALLNGKYTVNAQGSPFVPNMLKFTSASGANNWVTVSIK